MNTEVKKRNLRIIVAFIVLSLFLVGLNHKEYNNYFQKAVMICTQCIGLG